MRVLILGPNHEGGSLPPYLDALAAGLRTVGVHADRHGSTGVPFDQGQQRFWPIDRIVEQARALADQIDPTAYDIVALHSGNLEIDCLATTFWRKNARPPLVHHVHTLNPTLFRDNVPAPHWHQVVTDQIAGADAHLYFGRYAMNHLAGTVPAQRMRHVAWLPTTIPPDTPRRPGPALARALQSPNALPVISLYGYAAPWKDPALLTAAMALMRQPAKVVLAGQFWNDTEVGAAALAAPGNTLRIGATELVLVDEYMGAPDRAALISASAAGVFPYRTHPSFQGSGAIADYLAHSVPVVATDVANMAELIGDAGAIVPAADPSALAAALDRAIAADSDAADHARQRAARFTAHAHAARCAQLYQQILDHRTGAPA